MRKGVFFSMDAALALILVIVLALSLAGEQGAADGKDGVVESLGERAADRAIVKFYTDGLGAHEDELIGADAEFGKCAVVYDLDPDNELGVRARPEDYIFCEYI